MFRLFIFTFFLSQGILAAPFLKKIEGFDLVDGIFKKVDITDKEYIVIYFFNSNCPCSKAHFNHLNSLKNKYKKFQFVGFHSNKQISKKMAQKYFNRFEINFPIFLDKKLFYANLFKALKTPHVFIIDSVGRIIFQGGATNSRNPKRSTKFYLLEALKSINQGKKPKITYAKTLGCYIQR